MGAISSLPAFAGTSRRKIATKLDLWFTLPDVQRIFADAVRHHMAGHLEDAVARYHRVLFLQPDNADVHNNLGVALAAQGKVEAAMTRYKSALSLKPGCVDAHNNLGVALAAQGRIVEATTHYERVLVINPRHAGAHHNLGLVLAALGRMDEAVAQYERALSLRPDYTDACNNLGIALAAQGNSGGAMAQYRRAIAIDSRHAEAHNNLGNILREEGKFGDALAHYGRVIAIGPDQVEAHYHRAEVKTFRQGDAELSALETLARRADLPISKAPFLHFALAKALEDIGDHARAFEHMRKGNSSKRSQIDYDEPRVVDMFRRISHAFNGGLFDRFPGAGDSSSVPIFVVGMPRSGSTLIEQILASHPQIHAAGELRDLEQAIGTIQFPESIPSLDALTLRRIGQAYLARLPSLAEGQVRIVDKLPGNFLRIGLIRLILPNARIIHTVRHPADTCVSCYSKLFTSGQHFSYEMGELGRYYRCYRELMTHWRSMLPPGSMLDVAYEDVVGDLEGQARRLIAYCGLPWDDRCVNFHKTNRAVKTASAVQVRQPLFRSSLQRWRKYEADIGPLLEALGDVLAAKDFHHVRAADAGEFGAEFAVGAHLGGHVQNHGEVAR